MLCTPTPTHTPTLDWPYLPALGRFFSPDPLTQKYPELTPYQFASNTPVVARDLDGLEADFKFDSYERNDIRNAQRLFPGDSERQQAYIRRQQQARGFGAAFGLTVLATRGAILRYGWRATGLFLLEEGAEAAFESVTGIPVIIDPFDVIQKFGKGAWLSGFYKIKHSWERKRAAEYLASGSTVERITEGPSQTADFVVDGKITEFKYLKSEVFNSSTALGQLQKATEKPGVQVIDLDVRNTNATTDDLKSLYDRFKGTQEGKSFNGEVRFATKDGLISVKPEEVEKCYGKITMCMWKCDQQFN
jgi:hypothetical protein